MELVESIDDLLPEAERKKLHDDLAAIVKQRRRGEAEAMWLPMA